MSNEENAVYLLYHIHKYEKMNDFNESEDVKLLGIYSSKDNAEAAIKRYYAYEGFCDFPLECFEVEKATLNEDAHFCEGFFNT